ncbi:hypothetical protein [Rodentibacter genomosp. 2]|uniref:Lipoprotein n=1 Tax=Rodentibacter genomosp. 2 TaxID=1908266 RepID=A0A1V3JEA0_9PAST|nr:hypothetical protein [Rodentibacter genomosp. 2]OOF54928.1 hypothetical protein BKK55_08200 [Rodentibacter genomosp. 2]
MKKYLLLGLLGLFLIACSSLPTVRNLPPQQKTERLFKVEQRDVNGGLKQSSLLSLSTQPQAWRWVQSDPLGAPIARVILNNKGWQNDGFVMPNQQAKQLFSAIATALNTTPLFTFSHVEQTLQATTYFVDNKQVWRIIPRQSGIDIELADMSYWHIEELN